MAGYNEEDGNLSALNSRRPPVPAERPLTVDDVNNHDFGLSADDLLAFDQYRQANQEPSTGALSQSTYFPGYYPRGAVGSYSGNVIGSASLFGGGGALVPMGMFDAQDAAVQKAAASRLKEVDDFRKTTRKAPTSKLTNVNEALTKDYFKHQQESWNKALKKANGDPNLAVQLLKNDPDYFAKTKSFEDAAKLGDHIVDKKAQDDLDRRSGKFTPTPAYMAAERQLFTALDPKNPEFKNLANIWHTMQVERDFSDALDQVTKNTFAQEIGWSGAKDDEEFIRQWKGSKKEWSKKQIDGFVDTLRDNFYQGDPYWTEERLRKNVTDQLRGKVTTSDTKLSERRADDSKGADYTDAQPLTETETNVTDERAEGAGKTTGTVYGERAYKTTATHEKLELSIPISKGMVDTKGEKISSKSGHIKGNVSGIQISYYDKLSDRYLTKEEADRAKANGNHNISAKAVAVVNVKPATPDAGNLKKQNTVFVDASEIKGKFKNDKKKSGQRDYDDLIDELKSTAEEINKSFGAEKKSEAPAATASKSKNDPLGLGL